MNEFVKNKIERLCLKLNRKENISITDGCIFDYITTLIEHKVISDIKERQKKIPDLIIEDNRVRFGGELTPGCKNCLTNGGLTTIRSTYKCNLNCKFCYYYGMDKQQLSPLHYKMTDRLLTEDDIIRILEKVKITKGITWVSGEPLKEFNKIPSLSKRLTKLGIHQYMNTNGTLLSEEQMIILQDCGMSEMRINLAATNCSNKVIETMRVARKYFKYLCVESPMYKEFYDSFMLNRNKILDTGFDHMCINELHLQPGNFINFKNEDLYMYKFGYISPISSRQLAYDLLEVASDEKWNIVINECSNEQKFYRGIKSDIPVGSVNFMKETNLPVSFFNNSIKKLNEEETNNILKMMEGE